MSSQTRSPSSRVSATLQTTTSRWGKAVEQVKQQTTDWSVSGLVTRLMRAEGRDKFHCYRCGGATAQSKAIFPYCREACAGNRDKRVLYCTGCQGSNPDGLGMLCVDCLEGYGSGTIVDYNIFQSALIVLHEVSCDEIMKAYPTMYAMVVDCRNRLETHTASDDLLGHIKIFVFAEMYGIPALKALSLAKLCHDLSYYTVTVANADDIVTLLDFLYSNTHVGTGVGEGHGELLRKLVVHFVAQKVSTVMGSKRFAKLIKAGGTVVLDIMKSLARHQ